LGAGKDFADFPRGFGVRDFARVLDFLAAFPAGRRAGLLRLFSGFLADFLDGFFAVFLVRFFARFAIRSISSTLFLKQFAGGCRLIRVVTLIGACRATAARSGLLAGSRARATRH
jgi:hypothetical protein